MSNKPLTPVKPEKNDKNLDLALRPQRWEEYIGQEHVKKNLRILLDAAKKRREPVEHILLSGPSGLGKTSLAHLIARELSCSIRVTSGPAIEKVGDLASLLTNLLPHDILFVDEAHRLNKTIEEVLYPAMESRTLDIIIGKGPSARTLELPLPPFTLIAATTRVGLLSGPLRSRFGASYRLDFYAQGHMEEIVKRSARILSISVDPAAISRIARSSRATPRVANRLLKRVRDYAEVHPAGGNASNGASGAFITDEVARQALALLDIDELGLEPMDRRVLEVIVRKFNGGPVGLQAIAAASSEEEDTIAEVYEPYLMRLGFLERTPKGRVATERAYEHLGLSAGGQKTLLG